MLAGDAGVLDDVDSQSDSTAEWQTSVVASAAARMAAGTVTCSGSIDAPASPE